MSGTATISISVSMENLGHVPVLSNQYEVSGVDEFATGYSDIAASGELQISQGQVDTVTGLWIHVITGGSTAATGVSIDIAAASAFGAGDIILTEGQSIFLVPVYSSGEETYIKNLDSSTATIEYVVFGDNS